MPRYGANVRLPGGGVARICGSRLMQLCSACGFLADILCDYPVGPHGRTCDAPICEDCTDHREPDTDYCPTHAGWTLL